MTDDLHEGDKTGQWRDFLKLKYKTQMAKISREYPHKRSLTIDYREIEKWGVDGIHLADELVDNPGKVLEDIHDSIVGNELIRTKEGKVPKIFHVRFTNLPKKTRIRDIRAENVNRFVTTEGLIMSVSEVRPRIVEGVFRCPAGHFSVVRQRFGKFVEPETCLTDGCRFKRLDLMPKRSAFEDSQFSSIQEDLEGQRAGEQPQQLALDIADDLVGILALGDRVIINGILRSQQRNVKGEKSTIFDLFLEVNSIEREGKDYGEIQITEEEESEIIKISKSPDLLTTISQSILPAISGFEEEKKGLTLSLFAAPMAIAPGGKRLRGSIHVFLAGDPGISKTTLLMMLRDITPRSVYISGKGATGAGLTFAMVQDKTGDGRWRIVGGAAPRANGSNLYADELGLMEKDDIKSLIEFMETQIITVDKAGIHATLKAEEGVTIAINPKGGRFDMKMPLADQIDPKIPPQILSRCDLIYLLPDVPTETKDRKEAEDILGLWQGKMVLTEIQIPVDLLQKYIAYAKRRKVPVLNDAALRIIVDKFVEVRKGSGEGTITVTKRALETFVRLATAHAIMRFGNEVAVQDAEIAIKVLDYSLRQTCLDVSTGRLDSDKPTGHTKERRELSTEIIKTITDQGGKASMEVITREVVMRVPNMTEAKVKSTVEQMYRENMLCEAGIGKFRAV